MPLHPRLPGRPRPTGQSRGHRHRPGRSGRRDRPQGPGRAFVRPPAAGEHAQVKAPHSRYHVCKPDGRLPTSQQVTALEIVVREPAVIEYVETRPVPGPHGQPGAARTRRQRIVQLMRSDPTRAWHGREIAQWLGVTNADVVCVQFTQWEQTGHLHKVGPATRTLPWPAPEPLDKLPESLTTRPWPAAT